MWMVLSLAHAATDPFVPAGAMVADDDRQLVLEHTNVLATIEVGLAVVDVQQTFRNPFDEALDATYVFPLPPDAAVRHMELRCGARTLVADIRERQQAAQAYDQARQQGKRAALLEQQRDDLFTYRVSALCPGERVEVELQYVEEVPVRRAATQIFTFPTTVAPRYDPRDLELPASIPPTRDGRTLDLTVHIVDPLPIESLFSDSHDITVVREDTPSDDPGSGTLLRLATGDHIPNKDFELRWTHAGSVPRAAAVTAPGSEGDDDYMALTLWPQLVEDIERQRPRELLFVMDSSCSMQGGPWNTVMEAVVLALGQMEPHDTFNLVRFSNAASSLFDTPQPATSANIARAVSWAAHYEGGGTEMTAGIRHSLDMPGDPEALRLVLLMTDGYIGNDLEVFQAVEAHRGDARIFALGVGSSVNRNLLEGLARHGRGVVSYQLPRSPIEETIAAFYERIAHPAMTDLEVDFGTLDVDQQFPAQIPDLWAGQPLRISGRFTGGGAHTITVRGLLDGEPHALHVPLDLDRDAESHEAVATLWARRRIADLSRDLTVDPQAVAPQITALGLEHHLVTQHTSLIVVDDDPSPCGPASLDHSVPSLGAEGTIYATEPHAGSIGSAGSGLGGGGTAEGLGGLGTVGMGSGRSGYGSGGGQLRRQGRGGHRPGRRRPRHPGRPRSVGDRRDHPATHEPDPLTATSGS